MVPGGPLAAPAPQQRAAAFRSVYVSAWSLGQGNDVGSCKETGRKRILYIGNIPFYGFRSLTSHLGFGSVSQVSYTQIRLLYETDLFFDK